MVWREPHIQLVTSGTSHQVTAYPLSCFNIYDPVPTKGPDQESCNQYLIWALKYKNWTVQSVKLTVDFVNTSSVPVWVGIYAAGDQLAHSTDIENVMNMPLSKWKLLNASHSLGGSTKCRMSFSLNWGQISSMNGGKYNTAFKTGDYTQAASGVWGTSVPHANAFLIPWACDMQANVGNVQMSCQLHFRTRWSVPHPQTRFTTSVANVECVHPNSVPLSVPAPGGVHPALGGGGTEPHGSGNFTDLCDATDIPDPQ